MTNTWSLLYDELKMDEYPYSMNEFTFKVNSDDMIDIVKTPMTENRLYKYSEDEILKELSDYISGTYNQHYSAGDDKIQTLDLI